MILITQLQCIILLCTKALVTSAKIESPGAGFGQEEMFHQGDRLRSAESRLAAVLSQHSLGMLAKASPTHPQMGGRSRLFFSCMHKDKLAELGAMAALEEAEQTPFGKLKASQLLHKRYNRGITWSKSKIAFLL